MNIASEYIIVAGPIPQTTTWTTELDGNQVTAANTVALACSSDCGPTSERPLQRLAEVRRQEGITRRTVARRLGLSLGQVEEQEDPSSDILLSDLLRWQQALDVPVAELLTEPDCKLSTPVQLRARLLLIMKTVRSIQQRAHNAPLQRLVETLISQMVEMMPDLKDTAPWPTIGRRRRKHELGQAFFRRLSLDSLDELEGPEH